MTGIGGFYPVDLCGGVESFLSWNIAVVFGRARKCVLSPYKASPAIDGWGRLRPAITSFSWPTEPKRATERGLRPPVERASGTGIPQ